jgi:hypothetical protein
VKDTFCSRPVHPEDQARMLRVILDAEAAIQAELLLQFNDLIFDNDN